MRVPFGNDERPDGVPWLSQIPLSGQVWPVTINVPSGILLDGAAPGFPGMPGLGGSAIAFLWRPNMEWPFFLVR